MASAKEKFVGMKWLFLKPTKFFEDVVRSGDYLDCLLLLAAIALALGVGIVTFDPTRDIADKLKDGSLISGVLFILLLVITFIWGVFAALIGMRLRPRIASVLSLKSAMLRSLRVVCFSLTPLLILFFPSKMLLGFALVGVVALSVIGLSKALGLKILPAIFVQLIISGSMIGGAALAIDSFFKERANRAPQAFASKKMIGSPAPNILIQPTDGTAFHLEDLKGKIVILDFWATWCPPCRAGLPMVSEVAAKFKDKGVVFYAMGEGSVNQEKAFLNAHNIQAIPATTNAEGFEAFKVSAIPETVIIDQAGIVKYVQIGLSANEKEELTSEIESCLKASESP